MIPSKGYYNFNLFKKSLYLEPKRENRTTPKKKSKKHLLPIYLGRIETNCRKSQGGNNRKSLGQNVPKRWLVYVWGSLFPFSRKKPVLDFIKHFFITKKTPLYPFTETSTFSSHFCLSFLLWFLFYLLRRSNSARDNWLWSERSPYEGTSGWLVRQIVWLQSAPSGMQFCYWVWHQEIPQGI